MKKFNINDSIYIQITDLGWKHLEETVGEDYIKHCIKTEHYEKVIDGETWYRLQAHQVFSLLPISPSAFNVTYKTNIMIDDENLELVQPKDVDKFEYEMKITDEGTPFEINTWIPCATERIKNPEKIEEYIKKGLLRKISD